MGHDDDHMILPKFAYRILDFRKRNRVDCRARLVKKKDLRVQGEGTGELRRCFWPRERLRPLSKRLSFTTSHKAARRSAHSISAFSSAREIFRCSRIPNAIFIDGHRKRGRLLEEHTDARSQLSEIVLCAKMFLPSSRTSPSARCP